LFNRCDVPGYPNPDLCTRNYMMLVIKLLKVLALITKDPEIERYHRKFSGYVRLPNILGMYRKKYKTLKSLNRI
jgi:heparosan-N-sulfate-glucuronate 5-epimerase